MTDRYRDIIERTLGLAGITIDGSAPYDIRVHNPDLYKRVASRGSLGLGEAYMDGWWDCDQLEEFFFRILRARANQGVQLSWLDKLGVLRARIQNMQSSRKAWEAAPHYNVSNEFFEKLLDARVNYSCGYWNGANSLDQAQENKLDLVCRKVGLSKGDRLLDIGCGWGALVEYACQNYGCEAVGITISESQAEYVRDRCQGLPVEIIKIDYRDLKAADAGTFDKIISIGMFEHVGPRNYPSFMNGAHELLKEDGLVLLHTIGDNASNVSCDPWMDRYIFPNSVMPSIQQIGQSIEDLFVMEDWHNFGFDYYRTLMSWHDNLDRCKDAKIETEMPREILFRMWKYYLTSCAGAFKSRHLQLWQIVMSKGSLIGNYETVR